MAANPPVDVESAWQILPDRVATVREEPPLTYITIPMGTASARQVMSREYAAH